MRSFLLSGTAAINGIFGISRSAWSAAVYRRSAGCDVVLLTDLMSIGRSLRLESGAEARAVQTLSRQPGVLKTSRSVWSARGLPPFLPGKLSSHQ